MITAALKSPCHLIVKGHAGSAPAGKDLVCAAVSALTWALADSLKLECSQCFCKLSEGFAELKCPETAPMALLFRHTIRALQSLSEQYPDFVKVEIPQSAGLASQGRPDVS